MKWINEAMPSTSQRGEIQDFTLRTAGGIGDGLSRVTRGLFLGETQNESRASGAISIGRCSFGRRLWYPKRQWCPVQNSLRPTAQAWACLLRLFFDRFRRKRWSAEF